MASGPCKPSANASTLNPLAKRLRRALMSTEDGADAAAMFITLLVRKEALPLLPKTPNTYCQERVGIAAVKRFAASCGQIWRVRIYRRSADYTLLSEKKPAYDESADCFGREIKFAPVRFPQSVSRDAPRCALARWRSAQAH